MKSFLQKFGRIVKDTIEGFDRIVFKGTILPLVKGKGAMSFCKGRKILNKDYKDWMREQSQLIIGDAERYAQAHSGRGVEYISASGVRKEKLARERQKEMGVSAGLIGVWSALEGARSFKARFSKTAGFPQLVSEWTKCKHLYFYLDHEDFGFMNIRLQTWFPYPIQIALNGREWLRRGLERAGNGFSAQGNKFLHLDDPVKARRLLARQLDTRWPKMMNGFLPVVFPAMERILGPYLSYYWTLWQSEWAADFICHSPEALRGVAESLLRHAHMTGTSERVLRYFDRPMTKAGTPHAGTHPEVTSRVLSFGDGIRVRHWVGQNSVKVYTEQNVLRVETTVNHPGMFKVYRRAQGEPASKPKRHLRMRKGVADIALRAQVSRDVNHRLIEQLAACGSEKPAREIFANTCRSFQKGGRKVRALDPLGKDRALLEALSDPGHCLSGVRNAWLCERLQGTTGYRGKSRKQQSAKVTRALRLLRDHGLLRKLPRQRAYHLTVKGLELTQSLQAMLAASTEKLMEMAA